MGKAKAAWGDFAGCALPPPELKGDLAEAGIATGVPAIEMGLGVTTEAKGGAASPNLR